MRALPVLAVDLVGREGLVEHEHLEVRVQAGSLVVGVLQLQGGIQQGQVAAHDQGVRAVCGH